MLCVMLVCTMLVVVFTIVPCTYTLEACVLAKVVRSSLSLSLPTKISLLQSFDRPVFSSTSSLQTMIAARGGTADSFLCPHGQATHQPSGHGMTQHSSRVQKNSIHVEPIACSSPDKAKGSHPAKHEEKALFIHNKLHATAIVSASFNFQILPQPLRKKNLSTIQREILCTKNAGTQVLTTPLKCSDLSKRLAKPVIRRLSLEAPIKQQRRRPLNPRILVANTPHGNTDTVLDIRTSTHRSLVITRARTLNIQLGDRALAGSRAKQLQRSGVIGDGPDAAEVGLGADAVDGDASSNPLLDLGRHGLGLAVGGGIEVVVVDVEFRLGVGGARGFEGGLDEALAEDVVEDGFAEGAVFVEDLVDDVLRLLLEKNGTVERWGKGDLPMRRSCRRRC